MTYYQTDSLVICSFRKIRVEGSLLGQVSPPTTMGSFPDLQHQAGIFPTELVLNHSERDWWPPITLTALL